MQVGNRDNKGNFDLVVAPNEYAYLQGETNGRVSVGVGPCIISQSGQDRSVIFDPGTRRFIPCELIESVRTCPIASEGQYIVLENPSEDENQKHPKFEESDRQNSPKLKMGSKINIPGPSTFALWPGQVANVLEGHRLRSNQYLVMRIYNEEEAKENWNKAVFKPANANENRDEENHGNETASIQATTSVNDVELTIGKLFVIKGTDSSFYIPPTGVEVVPDGDNYVRNAVTLERLEYTILVDENGNKRYRRGPDVVFPEPTETFVQQNGKLKAKAIELHQTQGIHIKVIEDYKEGEKAHKEGDELFITGKENALYFPRKEHSTLQYGPDPKHYATNIPSGEGRYLLNRESGVINTIHGPKMLLPDPRKELVVRRILSQTQCNLMYPDNNEAALYNAELEKIMVESESGRSGLVSERDYAKKSLVESYGASKGTEVFDEDENAARQTRRGRKTVGPHRKAPKSMVIGGKFDNVPSIDLWTGYAVKVVSKIGERRVEVGPKTILLNYDESLEVLELSTGKPKNTDHLQPTVYLRVSNNKVSDILDVETSDNIVIEIKLSYRVNFDLEMKDSWFNVENYVKLLCDHTRSILKTTAKKHTVQEFYTKGMEIVRDTILQRVKNPEDSTKERNGLYFSENGMRITDVEVLDLHLKDQKIAQLLDGARKEVVVQNISMDQKHRELKLCQETERIEQEKCEAIATTSRIQSKFNKEKIELHLSEEIAKLDSAKQQEEEKNNLATLEEKIELTHHEAKLKRKRENDEVELEREKEIETLRQSGINADAQALIHQYEALQDGFTEALTALNNDDVLIKVAQATSVQQMIGGNSAVEVIKNILGDSPKFEKFMKRLTVGAEKSVES